MKKVILFLFMFSLIIGMGYGIASAKSPTEGSKLQVIAVNTGFNKDGNAIMKVFFTYKLDGHPIFPQQHTVNITWNEGWKLEGYNLKSNGKYSKNDLVVSPFNYSGNIDLEIDANNNFDKSGLGEGYVILTSANKELLSSSIKSSTSINFYYRSLVKDFQLSDSTAWDNADALRLN
ncbi:hypothetical protein [Paenisporosarcina sp. TG20]|uniref:hypothetical protein n=1 Tax=Paenisporosarcina sp. TG20 TaxID=1211706 RepID=UPI000314CC15|nr:hypothetical protein [Paenisporosarcina sp. TG20]